MDSPVTASIEKLRPYEAGKPIEELERELGVENAVKLASNENPLGPSPKAVNAMRGVLAESHRYPDASAFRLRERLAAELSVSQDEIIQGNGSNELLELLVRTFTTPLHHIVFASPSFVVYEIAALAHGVAYTAVPLRDDVHDLTRMAESVTANTRLMFIANPNNPTGTHVPKSSMVELLKSVPEEVIVAVDEAYFEYADAADYPDCLSLRGLRERLVVLRTFSKIHGLAALRIGYAVGPKDLIGYMNRLRAPFNVSTAGQVAALAALGDREHVERSRRMNREGRARLEEEMSRMGLRVAKSQANFVYVDLGCPARPVYERLLRLGVIVRPFGALPNKLRITVGTPPENDRFLAALAEVLS
jgi:histidinol-phosphate aminotransferase